MERKGMIICKLRPKDNSEAYLYKLLIIMDEEKEVTKEIWASSSKDLGLLIMVNVSLEINPYTLKARVNGISVLDSSEI